jgi:hypothetical protein
MTSRPRPFEAGKETWFTTRLGIPVRPKPDELAKADCKQDHLEE